MDLIKQLTGKNPSEYEPIAKSLVDNSDTELFKKLVQQDDFLFDFIKNNVAKRIQHACNKDNYSNLLNFLNIYSPSYETVLTEVLHNFGGDSLYPKMKELFLNGSGSQRAYTEFTSSQNLRCSYIVCQKKATRSMSSSALLKRKSSQVLDCRSA